MIETSVLLSQTTYPGFNNIKTDSNGNLYYIDGVFFIFLYSLLAVCFIWLPPVCLVLLILLLRVKRTKVILDSKNRIVIIHKYYAVIQHTVELNCVHYHDIYDFEVV